MTSEQKFNCGEFGCTITGLPPEWNLFGDSVSPEPGLFLFRWRLRAEGKNVPPKLKLAFSVPQQDIQLMWRPCFGESHHLFPYWWEGGKYRANLAYNAPVFSYMNQEGGNRLTFAFSDAKRMTYTHTGPTEASGVIVEIALFPEPEAPFGEVEFSLRVDRRPIHYSDALRDVSGWYAAMPGYAPAAVPEFARQPMYSTWYQYQRDVFASELDNELDEIAECGLGAVILDDGWQLAGRYEHGEMYACTGTWEPAPEKFPDLAGHVAKFHARGIRYMMWFAVPFIGVKEKVFEPFRDKCLYRGKDGTYLQDAAVLDPRFPEVREFTIRTYERAVLDWNLDGLKLDFIDSFHFDGPDPAIAEGYAGRDIESLPEAVDRLLTDTMLRLKALRPEIMIEFRQAYIGPAIRHYGNLFRAADCAMDLLQNRVRTIDLRLLSGDTAVHSDMLAWSPDDTPEIAALQLLNVLFSTPQISMRLRTLPKDHLRMLRFWISFCREHCDTLQKGLLIPSHPEASYPVVTALGEDEAISAIYESGRVVETFPGKRNLVVNATHRGNLLLDLRGSGGGTVSVFNVFGEKVGETARHSDFAEIAVPPSGYLEFYRKREA